MHVVFEESGTFKTAEILSESDTSLQVSLDSGRRIKIKANQVALRFQAPAPADLWESAQRVAESLDIDFLHACAPTDEFQADSFAKEVFGEKFGAVERFGLMLALHAAPMYFYRKGRQTYRAAPAETLAAAKATMAKREEMARQQAALVEAIVSGEGLPESIASQALDLLVAPDRQSMNFKALEQAAHRLQVSVESLLMGRGALPSAYGLHRARFIQECFGGEPRMDIDSAVLERLESQRAALVEQLPQASAHAYSIDDASTTEVDDAFSLTPLEEGSVRVGVHIAAPGLLIEFGDEIAAGARERASTAYFPGEKFTMLAPAVVGLVSLDAGRWNPAVSLYIDFDSQGHRIAHYSKVERVWVDANIRHGDWEALLEPGASGDASAIPWQGLHTLARLAQALRADREQVRGRPEPKNRVDFQFDVEWDQGRLDSKRWGWGRPMLSQRRRGSALDVLVSEFMILTNVTWGETLALGQRPGMYRCQSMGRVRMQTQPGPHQGLGVSSYAWSTSPIRRYADLVNQWQLLGILGHGRSPFRMGDAQLFADLAHFDGRYDRYAEFQSRMERYWSLRWLGLESGLSEESWDALSAAKPLREMGSLTRHDGVVRLARVPTTVRIPEWASLAAGSQVELDLLRFDALSLEIEARPVRVVEQSQLESYAVLGDPIDHSRSPAIHSAFADQTDQAIRYQAIQVRSEELEQRLDELANQGYLGLNLTVPLKEHVIALAKRRGWEISERARQAGAANTLIRSVEGWRCENTDGVGLVSDLHELLGADGLRGQSVLLIGAGGAARGVVGPLLQAGVERIVLANRTPGKAQAIADEIDPKSIRAIDLKLLELPEDADGHPWPAIVINATSGSLQGHGLVIAPEIFLRALLVLDMMYSANETVFLKQAREAGATRRVDGLGMLVGQAAESFSHWRGIRPDTAVVKEAIRASMNEEIE